MQPAEQLTSLQLELLKVFSFEPTEKELLEVRTMLGKFFANRFVEQVDKAVDEQGITGEDLDKWLNDEEQ